MRPESRQRGFGLVAAMFVVIIIAAVIATMAQLAETQSSTNNLGIQQARAYQAASAGVEYGIARVLASTGCTGFALDGFTIGVTCAEQLPVSVFVPEENKVVTFYTITATAEYGSAGGPDYVYRRLTAVVER